MLLILDWWSPVIVSTKAASTAASLRDVPSPERIIISIPKTETFVGGQGPDAYYISWSVL
jgi:hypothetical protein